jgi:hypothetical protein
MDRGARTGPYKDTTPDERMPAATLESLGNNTPLLKWTTATSAVESDSLGQYRLACLLAQAELVDDRLVTLGIVLLQVIQQTTALADHHEETAA